MKKSEISQLYEKYQGPKCSRTTYYKNIKAGMNFIDALKPIPHSRRYKPGRIKTLKFESELKRYYEQEGEKASRSRFYQRLYQGRTKEDAIKLVVPIHRKQKEKKKKQFIYIKSNTPMKPKEENSDSSEIRITYSPEESRIIKKEYESLIQELEEQILYEDVSKAKELNEKLEKIIAEYQIFISYNQ